nr:MAG TPA: Major capsid protein [Microviridae sp.]
MAQNIFDATFDANNRIDVNSFDWSHVNNLTTNFGRITPVFCELIPAKGSLRINPEFGLELMPMVFPVQTRMFARLNFFKVTLRSLWEDYSDFVSNFRDDLEEPYIQPTIASFDKMCTTGSLGDYLGLPTGGTVLSTPVSVPFSRCAAASSNDGYNFLATTTPIADFVNKSTYSSNYSVGLSCSKTTSSSARLILSTSGRSEYVKFSNLNLSFNVQSSANPLPFESGVTLVVISKDDLRYSVEAKMNISKDKKTASLNFSLPSLTTVFGKPIESARIIVVFNQPVSASYPMSSYTFSPLSVSDSSSLQPVTYNTYPFETYDTRTSGYPRLRAYRFRAYESVYNAYYRDIRNNPFVVNGKPVYNKWLPTMKGGADTTTYELHQCNWERDFLTTAVPNPQQGANAPLVGLTLGDVVTRSEDGTYSVQKQTVLVDEDGSKYGVSYKVSEDGERLVGVDYDPVSEKTPVTAINSYAELAALAAGQGSGFTIETLRYVNAYQKFLELNMRKGFSYKQIMQGRWDIDIRFDELLMPEFIGGISRELSMRTIEQTVDQQSEASQGQYAEALGSKSGIAGVYGNTSNNIEVFCDEESIIIGLLTVTPVPIYTQLVPKDFLYNGLLDHYQPEFDRIGFQPITYKEICPFNANRSVEQLNKTFGYQRPWYEYVAKYDNAHGLFRTDMKNFIMNRTFDGMPQLSQQFLLVDPDTVNQVFSVTEYTDKIFGYVKFNATARLPISRVAIPRLD